MAIILEGNDSSGKSFLADRIGLPIYRSGGPPLDHGHMIRCLYEQQKAVDDHMVLDRVTAISQQIYNVPLEVHTKALHLMLTTPKTILIYCRPSDLDHALSKHEVKSYDTTEHLEHVVKNYHLITEKYDDFMAYYPHIQYDWQNEDLDNGNFIRMIKSWQSDPTEWDNYFTYANWCCKYAKHELLYKTIPEGFVLSIMGKEPLALLKTGNNYILRLVSDLCATGMRSNS